MSKFDSDRQHIIYHRELNNDKIILEKFCEKTCELQQKTVRRLVTTLEGDIIEYRGEIYLSHTLYAKNYPKWLFDTQFEHQKEAGKAAKFNDVINYLYRLNKKNLGPIALDVELKDNLSENTIKYVLNSLPCTGIPFYIASFYGENLDKVYDIDSDVIRARHVLKTIDDTGYSLPILGMNAPKQDPDINIAQRKHASGNPTQIMYTPMHTPEQIIRLSREGNVVGVFTDIKLFEPKVA